MHASTIRSELEEPEAQRLLSTASLARLAYDGLNGDPYLVPVGFLWTGEAVVIYTHPTSAKVSAIRANPAVALSIDEGGPPAKSLLIRGQAAIDVMPGLPDEYLAASLKSMDESAAAEFEAEVRNVYDEMARISVSPTWARFYDYGTNRIPPFPREAPGLSPLLSTVVDKNEREVVYSQRILATELVVGGF